MIPFILMTAFLLCFIWLLFYELSRLDRENKSLRAELEKEKDKVVEFDHDREQKHTNSEKPKEWSEDWREEGKKDDGINSIHSCDIDYVHELQHALRLCGIDKDIEL